MNQVLLSEGDQTIELYLNEASEGDAEVNFSVSADTQPNYNSFGQHSADPFRGAQVGSRALDKIIPHKRFAAGAENKNRTRSCAVVLSKIAQNINCAVVLQMGGLHLISPWRHDCSHRKGMRRQLWKCPSCRWDVVCCGHEIHFTVYCML